MKQYILPFVSIHRTQFYKKYTQNIGNELKKKSENLKSIISYIFSNIVLLRVRNSFGNHNTYTYGAT